MSTIRSNREIDAIFGEGRRVAHRHVVALIRPTPAGRGPEGRVAFVAGRKVGGAVLRNRAKRTMRAAASRLGGPWAGDDVVFIARATTGTAPAHELDEAFSSVLRKGRVIQE